MRFKKFLIFSFYILLISNLIFSNSGSVEKISTPSEQVSVFDEIFEEYGVKVVTNVNTLIPQYWIDYPVSGKYSKLSPNLYKKAASYIKIALAEYPKNFLKKHLHNIGICDTLSFYDVPYGGTAVYDNHSIIITVSSKTQESWFVATIHHELNHLLVYWNNFPQDIWRQTNKPGFKYGNGGVEAIKNKKSSVDRTEAAFREGFVCEYGQSDINEDIATFSEYAIQERADFLTRAVKYPIIKRKFDILKSFYYQLDKRFDEKFWMGNKTEIDSYNQYSTENLTDETENLTDEDEKQKKKSDNKSTLVNTLTFYRTEEKEKKGFNFNSRNVSYLYYYLLINNEDQQEKTISVTTYYYYPDGTEMGHFSKEYSCYDGDKLIICSWGFGWKEQGYWVKGKYRVVFYLNGDYLTETYVTIE